MIIFPNSDGFYTPITTYRREPKLKSNRKSLTIIKYIILKAILGYSTHSNSNRHSLTSNRNRENGIRSQDHDLLKFEVPIAPEKVILHELNAPERK